MRWSLAKSVEHVPERCRGSQCLVGVRLVKAIVLQRLLSKKLLGPWGNCAMWVQCQVPLQPEDVPLGYFLNYGSPKQSEGSYFIRLSHHLHQVVTVCCYLLFTGTLWGVCVCVCGVWGGGEEGQGGVPKGRGSGRFTWINMIAAQPINNTHYDISFHSGQSEPFHAVLWPYFDVTLWSHHGRRRCRRNHSYFFPHV